MNACRTWVLAVAVLSVGLSSAFSEPGLPMMTPPGGAPAMISISTELPVMSPVVPSSKRSSVESIGEAMRHEIHLRWAL